jgi:hypothetical protein
MIALNDLRRSFLPFFKGEDEDVVGMAVAAPGARKTYFILSPKTWERLLLSPVLHLVSVQHRTPMLASVFRIF